MLELDPLKIFLVSRKRVPMFVAVVGKCEKSLMELRKLFKSIVPAEVPFWIAHSNPRLPKMDAVPDTARWNFSSILQQQLEQLNQSNVDAHANANAVSATDTVKKNVFEQSPPNFLFELLQNAVDCGGNEITANFNAKKDAKATTEVLLFVHNGRKMDLLDLEAITGVGYSTKRSGTSEGAREIGNKGIGFKALLSVTERVEVRSGEFGITFYKDNPRDILHKSFVSTLSHLQDLTTFEFILPKFVADKIRTEMENLLNSCATLAILCVSGFPVSKLTLDHRTIDIQMNAAATLGLDSEKREILIRGGPKLQKTFTTAYSPRNTTANRVCIAFEHVTPSNREFEPLPGSTLHAFFPLSKHTCRNSVVTCHAPLLVEADRRTYQTGQTTLFHRLGSLLFALALDFGKLAIKNQSVDSIRDYWLLFPTQFDNLQSSFVSLMKNSSSILTCGNTKPFYGLERPNSQYIKKPATKASQTTSTVVNGAPSARFIDLSHCHPSLVDATEKLLRKIVPIECSQLEEDFWAPEPRQAMFWRPYVEDCHRDMPNTNRAKKMRDLDWTPDAMSRIDKICKDPQQFRRSLIALRNMAFGAASRYVEIDYTECGKSKYRLVTEDPDRVQATWMTYLSELETPWILIDCATSSNSSETSNIPRLFLPSQLLCFPSAPTPSVSFERELYRRLSLNSDNADVCVSWEDEIPQVEFAGKKWDGLTNTEDDNIARTATMLEFTPANSFLGLNKRLHALRARTSGKAKNSRFNELKSAVHDIYRALSVLVRQNTAIPPDLCWEGLVLGAKNWETIASNSRTDSLNWFDLQKQTRYEHDCKDALVEVLKIPAFSTSLAIDNLLKAQTYDDSAAQAFRLLSQYCTNMSPNIKYTIYSSNLWKQPVLFAHGQHSPKATTPLIASHTWTSNYWLDLLSPTVKSKFLHAEIVGIMTGAYHDRKGNTELWDRWKLLGFIVEDCSPIPYQQLSSWQKQSLGGAAERGEAWPKSFKTYLGEKLGPQSSQSKPTPRFLVVNDNYLKLTVPGSALPAALLSQPEAKSEANFQIQLSASSFVQECGSPAIVLGKSLLEANDPELLDCAMKGCLYWLQALGVKELEELGQAFGISDLLDDHEDDVVEIIGGISSISLQTRELEDSQGTKTPILAQSLDISVQSLESSLQSLSTNSPSSVSQSSLPLDGHPDSEEKQKSPTLESDSDEEEQSQTVESDSDDEEQSQTVDLDSEQPDKEDLNELEAVTPASGRKRGRPPGSSNRSSPASSLSTSGSVTGSGKKQTSEDLFQAYVAAANADDKTSIGGQTKSNNKKGGSGGSGGSGGAGGGGKQNAKTEERTIAQKVAHNEARGLVAEICALKHERELLLQTIAGEGEEELAKALVQALKNKNVELNPAATARETISSQIERIVRPHVNNSDPYDIFSWRYMSIKEGEEKKWLPVFIEVKCAKANILGAEYYVPLSEYRKALSASDDLPYLFQFFADFEYNSETELRKSTEPWPKCYFELLLTSNNASKFVSIPKAPTAYRIKAADLQNFANGEFEPDLPASSPFKGAPFKSRI